MSMMYQSARPDDLDPLVDLLVEAYHCDRRITSDTLRQRGLSTFRVVRGPSRLEAALELISIGQWFGGRRVSCGVIASVATHLPARGTGVASTLMRAALAEMRGSGIALSTLYASSASLYRRLGYERAGHLVRYDLPLAGLARSGREGQVERLDRTDAPEILEIYQACARRDAGLLDRDQSFWIDRFDPLPDAALAAYVVRVDGRAEGYVLLDENPHDRLLVLRDVMFTTRRAGQRILGLLAEHGSQLDAARWWGGPQDPLAHLLAEQQAVPKPHQEWMLRIVDPAAALHERGYPTHLDAELHLELTDPVFDENCGRWEVQVSAGHAIARRGGRGRIRLDVGALAALYSGHMPPGLLALLDRLSGPPEDIALAGLVFAGPAPYMPDAF
jgi:predicted acetyltransferase